MTSTSGTTLTSPGTVVRATWRGGRRYDVGRASGPTVTLDGEGKAGPGPVDTLLGALAACASIDVVEILEKRRTPPARLEVIVNADRRTEPPRRVLRATLVFHVDGDGIESAHARRAIALSFERYCSVAATLAPDLALMWQLVLNGATEPGAPNHTSDGATVAAP